MFYLISQFFTALHLLYPVQHYANVNINIKVNVNVNVNIPGQFLAKRKRELSYCILKIGDR